MNKLFLEFLKRTLEAFAVGFVFGLVIGRMVSPAHGEMIINAPIEISHDEPEPKPADTKQSNVIMGLQAFIEGKVPAGTVCYASVQTDTVTCRKMNP